MGMSFGQLLDLAQFVLLIWSLLHLARTRPDAYPAVDKQTKQFWLLLLAGTLVVTMVLGIFRILGLIVALIYLLDVKPAVDRIQRGG